MRIFSPISFFFPQRWFTSPMNLFLVPKSWWNHHTLKISFCRIHLCPFRAYLKEAETRLSYRTWGVITNVYSYSNATWTHCRRPTTLQFWTLEVPVSSLVSSMFVLESTKDNLFTGHITWTCGPSVERTLFPISSILFLKFLPFFYLFFFWHIV